MMVSITSAQKNIIIFFIEGGYDVHYLESSQKLLVENKIRKDCNTAIPLLFLLLTLPILWNTRRFRNQQSEGWSWQLAGFNIFLKDTTYLAGTSKKDFLTVGKCWNKADLEKVHQIFIAILYVFLYYFQVYLFKCYFWSNCCFAIQ